MFLKKVDFLSSDITLFYKGQDHHSSIASGILSILMGIFIIFLIGYLSIDIIKKQHPTSFYFTKFIEEIGTMPLNSSSLFHYISLIDYNGIEMDIDIKALNIIGVSVNDGKPSAVFYSNGMAVVPSNNDSLVLEFLSEVFGKEINSEFMDLFTQNDGNISDLLEIAGTVLYNYKLGKVIQ
jgi:hypothetical protein